MVSGQSLDEFFAERIFGPLGMTDTRWWADGDDASRLAALYTVNPSTGAALRYDHLGARALQKPTMLAGGAGLLSTATDYHKFTQMLLREGGYDGGRLLGSRTMRFMVRNHLPGGQDLQAMNTGGFAETNFDGIGFGLGFAVLQDPIQAKQAGSAGSVLLGRRGEHGILGGPGGGAHGDAVHPAAALEHVPASAAASPARLRGIGLTRHNLCLLLLQMREQIACIRQTGEQIAFRAQRRDWAWIRAQ